MTIKLSVKFSEKEIGQSICALLNAEGGIIESKIPMELDKTLEKYADDIRSKIEPNCIFYDTFDEERNTWILEVPEVTDKPYGFEGEAFVLVNENIEKANINTIRRLLKITSTQVTRWEKNISYDLKLDDLDIEEIQKTAEFQNTHLNPKDFISFLKTLDLARNGELTNATDVCLSKRPSERLPQVNVRVVSYKNKVDDTYNTVVNLSLPICKLIEEVKKIIFSEIRTPNYAFDEHGKRTNTYFYPEKAIHEAVVNAVAHRDYSFYQGGILIDIGENFLKIWNSGSLPEEVAKSLKEKKANYVSILPNPDIAKFLFIRNYMERTGRGSQKIIFECNKQDVNVEWEYNNNDSGVAIIFSQKSYSMEISESLKKLISVMDKELTRQEIQDLLKIKDS
ncbi:ATP-binding protein, partial [Acinetobacter baumannii]